ncbi:hypothetical protein Ancab_022671 [Ancistrocladus abbreviatus]
MLPHLLLILLISTPTLLLSQQQPPPSSDAKILLKFKQSLSNTNALSNWNDSSIPCSLDQTTNWVGLLCSNGTLWGLQLQNMNLSGLIDIDSLVQLPPLRTISLMNNSFSGPIPEINKLGTLRSVFLSNNNFSGVIRDDAFLGMKQLKKVYLANNKFEGSIPSSLAALPRLLEVSLEGNDFNGEIPNFDSSALKMVNFSYNSFNGLIPSSLSHFNSSSFLGNNNLCGQPLDVTCKLPEPPKPPKKFPIIPIIIIVLGVPILVAVTIALFLTKTSQSTPEAADQLRQLPPEKVHQKTAANGGLDYQTQPRELDRPVSYKKSDNGKLCFLRNDRDKFEMQDLLRASAEVLGSGSFGSSYKAILTTGPTFVVKRFRQMNNVGKEEFQEHMKRIGRLRHPNILPLVAYFHKRDEKLLITEHVENGSLASHLHSKRSEGESGLSWPIRLKIIKGVARGLAYLYREFPHLSLPHGHLKSSNVLLDDAFEPLLSDYALSPVINREHAEQVMVAYKSPEFTTDNRTTKKTDVWCLGILILELLTGKFPANYLKHGRGASEDLAAWVNSVVGADWTSEEVFDAEMNGGGARRREGGGEKEMVKLLKIGMWCCEWNVEKRWGLREAVEKIEELKESDSDDDLDFPSDYTSSHDVEDSYPTASTRS